MLDEPTSALDWETAGDVRASMRRLEREGVGVLVITHDREMMRACREVVVLGEGGRVLERGGFETLLRSGGALTRLLGEGGVGAGGVK